MSKFEQFRNALETSDSDVRKEDTENTVVMLGMRQLWLKLNGNDIKPPNTRRF